MSQFHRPPDDWRCECGSTPYTHRIPTGLQGKQLYYLVCSNTGCVHYGAVTMFRPAEIGGADPQSGTILAAFRLAESDLYSYSVRYRQANEITQEPKK